MTMKRILIAALAAMSLTGAGHAADLKIGLIAPSPFADVGWAHQLSVALDSVKEEYGDRVEIKKIDSVPEGPDAARVMNQMVNDGDKMLILGSFGYFNDGLKLARQHPDVAILHASGYKQTANFGTFTARNYEGFYVAAQAAAMLTKTKTIGLVAAFAVPEVVADVNAITLAAQKQDPSVEVKVIWLNTWFDPAKAQQAARALVSQGADVLFSLNQDTPSVVNVAEAEGVYVVNTGSDMKKYAPKWMLASVTTNWDDYFVEEVGKKLDGTFKGSDFRGGLKAGAVKIESWSTDLTDEQMATLKATEDAIASGEMHVFEGPIKDQSGEERVAAGEHLPDPGIFGMNWLVSGVTGALPK
jgi:simple sugar transport system substrate-binding protein